MKIYIAAYPTTKKPQMLKRKPRVLFSFEMLRCQEELPVIVTGKNRRKKNESK